MKAVTAKRSAAKVSAQPLLRRLREREISQSKFAVDHGYTPADVTNWKARGVPRGELPKIAAWCKLTVDAYLIEAGQPAPARQKGFEAHSLISDYEALPDGLKEIVARKAADLRRFVDGLPSFVRESLKQAPTDPQQYREWELEIEAAIAGRDHQGVKK